MAGGKKGFFSRLKEGLNKTRDNIVAGIDAVFYGASEIDDDFYEELEEILIMGDIGVNATNDIIERMKDEVKKRHLRHPSECKELLVESIKEQMSVGETAYDFEKKQSVIFVIGVNGVGKTTSVGKLASILKGQGKKVLIAAADTFRAAAGDQLAEWAHRAGVDMIGGADGADPASVIYDAVNAAKARKADILICDTAGRLHNKKNLMEELKKMNRIIDREFPDAHRENLIVLDGTTGQNALSQAREFGEVANLTGVILTKMDGTAKGGIAVAIQSELNVPVKYIGVGETIEDLQKFHSEEFVNALFDVKTEKSAESERADEAYVDEENTDKTYENEERADKAYADEGNADKEEADKEDVDIEQTSLAADAPGEGAAADSYGSGEETQPETFGDSAAKNDSSVMENNDAGDSVAWNSGETDQETVDPDGTDSDTEDAGKSKKKKWFFWK